MAGAKALPSFTSLAGPAKAVPLLQNKRKSVTKSRSSASGEVMPFPRKLFEIHDLFACFLDLGFHGEAELSDLGAFAGDA